MKGLIDGLCWTFGGSLHKVVAMKPVETHNSLGQLGEFGLIDRIRRQVSSSNSVTVGIGDDCAATTLDPGHLLLTSKDLLIEDVHFCRNWTDMYHLGRKSAAVNLSDIAAMGGKANHLFLGVGLTKHLSEIEIDQFTSGFLDEINSAGATLCGGDTCHSPKSLLISVTVHGSIAEEHLLCRDGAQIDDDIYVSGTIGDSALALALLQRGETPSKYLAQRHHSPTPRLTLGQAIAQGKLATAMIDVSDGIFSDLGHILEQSQLGAQLIQKNIPLSDEAKEYLAENPQDCEIALRGGEDYELLFCAPAHHRDRIAQLAHRLQLPITRIGHCVSTNQGMSLIDSTGTQQQIQATGFNHFR